MLSKTNSRQYLFMVLFMIQFCLGSCKQSSELNIAFLTDLHVVPGNKHEQALKDVVEEINRANYDFVVITGDLTNMGSDDELHVVKNCIDRIKHPCYVLPGNHETNWSETGGASYQKLFGDDRFSFETENYHFVGFNTGPYMKMGDGHVKNEDFQWLNDILANIPADKHLISMAHYPLCDGLDNWPQVTEVLKRNNARFALCGHGHRLKLMNFNGITGVMGRSLLGRDKSNIGYNVIKLKGDSVWVAEKKLGEQANNQFAWHIGQTTQIDSLQEPELPNYDLNSMYPNVEAEVLYTNESSILGGVAYSADNKVAWLSSCGTLKVFNAQNKSVLWEKHLGKPQYSTPVFTNQCVITGTSQGAIKAFNSTNGELMWQTEIAYPVFSEGVVEGDFLFIGCGKGGLYKVNIHTGKVVWDFKPTGGFVQAKPCLTNREVVFGAWDRHLYCLDKVSGKLKWKWTNGHKAMLYSPGNVVPVVNRDEVFIVAPDRYLTVLSLKDGSEIYRTNEHKVRESCGLSSDGDLFMAKLMNDSIVGYSTNQTHLDDEWSVHVGFGYEHNPCPLVERDGVVYGGTKNGEVFAVDTQKQLVLWRHKVSNSSINKMLFDSQKRLLVNTMDGKIVLLNSSSKI